MRNRLFTLLSCLALLLAGCAVSQLTATLRRAGDVLLPAGSLAGAPQAAIPQEPPITVATQREGDYGTIRVNVKWPDRDPARYTTQALPPAANSIHLKVSRKSDGTQVGEALIPRASGASSATASLRVKAESGLTLRGRAYKEAQPDTASASVIAEGSVDVDVVGSMVASPSLKLRIRIQGDVTTYAGDPNLHIEGTGEAARFFAPSGIFRDPANGNLFVSVYNGVIKITPQGQVTTLAGGGDWGSLDGTGTAARFMGVAGITRDSTGDFYVVQGYGGQAVRKVTSGGVTSGLAFADHTRGITIGPSDNLYVTDSRQKNLQGNPNRDVNNACGLGSSWLCGRPG